MVADRSSFGTVLLVLICLICALGPRSGRAEPPHVSSTPQLTAICRVSPLPDEPPELELAWSGVEAIDVEVWNDLDEDGQAGAGEPTLGLKRIGPGVTSFEIELGWMQSLGVAGWSTGLKQTPVQAVIRAPLSCGWSTLEGPFGEGTSGTVRALAVYNDGTGSALYVGGLFETAGGVVVNNIAKWDGTTWSALAGPSGTGTDAVVIALTVFDDGGGPALYAGGSFTTAGGVEVNHVARWDGSGWSDLSGPAGTGVGGSFVKVLTSFDDGTGPALYAGGQFTTAGGLEAGQIARWDGQEWSALTGPSGNGVDGFGPDALAIFDDGGGADLYVGGWFTSAGGLTANYIARWDGTEWSTLDYPTGTGMGGPVSALATFDDSAGHGLIAGGFFQLAGGVTANRIAKWDGSSWSPLATPSGNGTNGSVEDLAVLNCGDSPALYAGGGFTTAGGLAANRIAKWDGAAWSDLSGPSGNGVDDFVNALMVFNDDGGASLIAGGTFGAAGGGVASRIARWGCSGSIFVDSFDQGSTAAWDWTMP